MVLVPKPSKVAYERPVGNLSSLRCPTRYNSKHGLIILIGIILHVQYFFRIGMACMSPMVRHGSLQEHVEKDVNALGMIIDLLWLLQAKGQEKTTCSSHSKLWKANSTRRMSWAASWPSERSSSFFPPRLLKVLPEFLLLHLCLGRQGFWVYPASFNLFSMSCEGFQNSEFKAVLFPRVGTLDKRNQTLKDEMWWHVA